MSGIVGGSYMFKVRYKRKLEKSFYVFKVNNEGTRTTSFDFFLNVHTVNFEHIYLISIMLYFHFLNRFLPKEMRSI